MTTSSSPSRQPGDVTLGSYDAAAHLYLMHSAPPGPAVLAYLDEVARLVGDGTVLELGSGPVLAVTLKEGTASLDGGQARLPEALHLLA